MFPIVLTLITFSQKLNFCNSNSNLSETCFTYKEQLIHLMCYTLPKMITNTLYNMFLKLQPITKELYLHHSTTVKQQNTT